MDELKNINGEIFCAKCKAQDSFYGVSKMAFGNSMKFTHVYRCEFCNYEIKAGA
jgi:hypothetical protein